MLARVDIATFSCFNHLASWMLGFVENPAPWPHWNRLLLSTTRDSWKLFNENIYSSLIALLNYFRTYCQIIPSRWELCRNLLLPRASLMGIPFTMGFRTQLIVVSGLSVGIPSTVGFWPQLIVVFGLSVGIRSTVGFRLSWSHRLSQSPFTFFNFS
jgi:hypothetical protein